MSPIRTSAVDVWRPVVRSRLRGARYLGWLGHGNLGDEVMFDAVRSYVSPMPLYALPDRPARWHRAAEAMARRSPVVLGGGTLIGSPGLALPYARGVQGPGAAVFGAGVMDPEFPHFYRGRDAVAELRQWAELLADSTYVGVRGPRSAELLHDHGLEVEIVGDPACFFVRDDEFWTPAGGRHVSINVGQAWGRTWGSEEDLLGSLVGLVGGLVRGGARMEFLVVWPEDLPVATRIANESGAHGAPIHTVYDDAEGFQQLVRGADLFIGVKLHASALAAVAGVPVLCLEYQPKCRDFMRSLEAEEACVRTDRLDVASTIDLAWELAGDGPSRSHRQLRAARALRSRQVDAGRRVREAFWSRDS